MLSARPRSSPLQRGIVPASFRQLRVNTVLGMCIHPHAMWSRLHVSNVHSEHSDSLFLPWEGAGTEPCQGICCHRHSEVPDTGPEGEQECGHLTMAMHCALPSLGSHIVVWKMGLICGSTSRARMQASSEDRQTPRRAVIVISWPRVVLRVGCSRSNR